MLEKVSFLVSNQSYTRLKELFTDLFSYQLLGFIEIIYIDDSVDRNAWDIACKYASDFPGRMTISKNPYPLGASINEQNLLRMARTRLFALSTDYLDISLRNFFEEFEEFIKSGYNERFRVLLRHPRFLSRRSQAHSPFYTPSIHNPLVCITVHNYNYGRFLRECLDSAVNQTYKNIRILFSDNASTDESWAIANQFAERYPRLFTLTRNRVNFGSHENIKNCEFHLAGQLYLQLCSDDMLALTCVEECVAVYRKHPDVGMIMFHRDIVDANGTVSDEFPFFNCSFKASPGAMSDIYLLSSINPSISQIMYNLESVNLSISRTLIDRWYSNRFRDFILASKNSVAYLNRALMRHRIHGANDNLDASANLLEIIGPYVANLEFERIAEEFGIDLKNKAIWREKLGLLSLRYSYRHLLKGETEISSSYLHLSSAISSSVKNTKTYITLSKALFGSSVVSDEALLELRQSLDLYKRAVSYNPPEDALIL